VLQRGASATGRYETIVADMRMLCGNIELGRAWAAGA
jgi:hypothetical protein